VSLKHWVTVTHSTCNVHLLFKYCGFTVIDEKETKTKNKQEIKETTPYRGKIRKMVIEPKCEVHDLH